jgi:PhnB protein
MASPPPGYRTVTPYLVVKDIEALITFLKDAFGAEESERVPGPDGVTRHAEVRIGDSVVMMGAAQEGYPPLPAALYLYVEDTDASYASALQAGAESLMEPADQFYGDRNAGVRDSQGITWWIATRVENLTAEELRKRALTAKH